MKRQKSQLCGEFPSQGNWSFLISKFHHRVVNFAFLTLCTLNVARLIFWKYFFQGDCQINNEEQNLAPKSFFDLMFQVILFVFHLVGYLNLHNPAILDTSNGNCLSKYDCINFFIEKEYAGYLIQVLFGSQVCNFGCEYGLSHVETCLIIMPGPSDETSSPLKK